MASASTRDPGLLAIPLPDVLGRDVAGSVDAVGLGVTEFQPGDEVFAVLFLDGQHRLIEFERLFHGTLTQTSVYPREVLRQALRHNAGAVIPAHNHPSGVAEPSRADERLTQTIESALQLVDVRVLDHLVVGQGSVITFAERGLL